ncbi:FabD/lysophospholipase-like protein, partial [Phlegmacium glaucopus]
VLSIDGCGFRGRTQLLVLEELMQRMRASPSDPVKRPCDVFDLIVGTAAGGLIAILLGRLGMHCGDAIKAYEELERVLFLDTAHSNPPTIKDILTNPSKFNSLNFENKLKTIITGALGPQAKTFMFDTANRTGWGQMPKCQTLVTLVNQNAVTDKDAYRIRSYKDPKLIPDVEPITGHIWEIWEAAIGATGCPRLFSPLNLQGSLFQAANASGFSNPSMIAYIEALDLFGNNANITLVSLGMGLRNPDNYSSTVTEGEINDALALIAKDLDKIGDNNLREFVRQAQLAATSTQIKHLRVAERIGRAG